MKTKLPLDVKTKMKVSKMRASSRGYKGLALRVMHHAKPIAPIIAHVAACMPTWDFAEWRQGEGAQFFRTLDGRLFRLEPIQVDGGYVGIRLVACEKERGGFRHTLLEIFHDRRNGVAWDRLTDFLTDTAKAG